MNGKRQSKSSRKLWRRIKNNKTKNEDSENKKKKVFKKKKALLKQKTNFQKFNYFFNNF